MTPHPLHTVLKQLDYSPGLGFREALRAQLLADLERAGTHPVGPQLVADNSDIDQPQEVTVLKKIDRQQSTPRRTRALLGVAAALVVVAGATAVIAIRSRSADDDTPFTGNDASIARAALISVDQLGPGWQVDPLVTRTWENWRAAAAFEPKCADHEAAVGQIEAEAKGDIAPFFNLQNQVAFELLSIYPTTGAASRVMDSIDTPGFQECWFAISDTISNIDFPGHGPITSGFELPPPTPHGDRQIDFGMETHFQILGGPNLSHTVFVQVGRAIISLIVSPDGLKSDDPTGATRDHDRFCDRKPRRGDARRLGPRHVGASLAAGWSAWDQIADGGRRIRAGGADGGP